MFSTIVSALAQTTPSVTDWIGAIAAALTAVVAIVAAFYAWSQVSESRATRRQAADIERERAQPYVVLVAEQNPLRPVIVELVAKNYGATAARNVRFDLDPWPSRMDGDKVERVPFPDVIPVLAPGQEWRTFWDSGSTRPEGRLPDRHEGVVRYEGLDGEAREIRAVLDLAVIKSRAWMNVKSVNDVAKAVEGIQKTMKAWTEGFNSLRVISRDGDAKDAQREAERPERIRRYEQLRKMVEPNEPDLAPDQQAEGDDE